MGLPVEQLLVVGALLPRVLLFDELLEHGGNDLNWTKSGTRPSEMAGDGTYLAKKLAEAAKK